MIQACIFRFLYSKAGTRKSRNQKQEPEAVTKSSNQKQYSEAVFRSSNQKQYHNMYIKQTDVNSPLAPFWPWVADFLNPTNRTMPVDRLRRPTHGLVRLHAGSVWVPLANDRLDHHDAQEEGERSTSGQQRCTRQYKKNKHNVRTQTPP